MFNQSELLSQRGSYAQASSYTKEINKIESIVPTDSIKLGQQYQQYQKQLSRPICNSQQVHVTQKAVLFELLKNQTAYRDAIKISLCLQIHFQKLKMARYFWLNSSSSLESKLYDLQKEILQQKHFNLKMFCNHLLKKLMGNRMCEWYIWNLHNNRLILKFQIKSVLNLSVIKFKSLIQTEHYWELTFAKTILLVLIVTLDMVNSCIDDGINYHTKAHAINLEPKVGSYSQSTSGTTATEKQLLINNFAAVIKDKIAQDLNELLQLVLLPILLLILLVNLLILNLANANISLFEMVKDIKFTEILQINVTEFKTLPQSQSFFLQSYIYWRNSKISYYGAAVVTPKKYYKLESYRILFR
ncbi:unnamed protein product [Paramecium octaurelia]|uniref:Transmembrane protein n=1 Tax=Paramecium octaurelia TaxID=43137 RepID=A0A8S1UHM1_PAROT|nr:unnamed protein product [Paramecium octaurelia]